jgi:hypothetical protein
MRYRMACRRLRINPLLVGMEPKELSPIAAHTHWSPVITRFVAASGEQYGRTA